MKIGFIGLGNMGLPMAKNLLKAGVQVQGFDLSATALQNFANAGGLACTDAIAAIQQAQIVVSMLPASSQVQELYSPEGVLGFLQPGTLVIDCSTISASTARQVADQLSAKGMDMVDAPVSGGTAAAEAGRLTFMVGGTTQQLERARPVLDLMGQKIFHAGESGAGQVAKVCNNLLLGIIMVGSSEALQLGMAHGLDPAVLSHIIGSSSGANWVLSTNNPCPNIIHSAPSSRNYEGGFAVDLMLKDLRLAQQAAQEVNARTPLGSIATNLYSSHSQNGYGKKDLASIFQSLAS